MRGEKSLSVMLFSLFIALAPFSLWAQEPFSYTLDRNRDGKLSWDEIVKPAMEIFDLYDKNKNGSLEKEEFEAIPHAKTDFSHLDRDHNGSLSPEELKEEAKRRFSLCDRNGDGFLDLDELKSCPSPTQPIKVGIKGGEATYQLKLYHDDFIPIFSIFF